MYRVLDLILSDEDFELLKDATMRYEAGDMTLGDFLSIAKYVMEKYGKRLNDVWRYEYAIYTGHYEFIPQLIRAILRFRRPIRRPFDRNHYDYHWIQVTVFTIGNWTRDDVRRVAEQIIDELTENWNRLGGGVTFVPEYSIYDPPEILTGAEFTEEDYRWLKSYLDRFNPIARNPRNWFNYRPPADFRVSEHILSHYIVCGVEEDKRVVPEYDLLNALHVECPCEEGTDFPVSESLAVYASTDTMEFCMLWKKGGWRKTGAIYIPPTSGKPPSEGPAVPPGKTQLPGKVTVVTPEEKMKQARNVVQASGKKTYPNPLKDWTVEEIMETFPRKFWMTLILCKKYGMNPIPLLPNSKMPAIQWKYLTDEPIKPEHLLLLKDDKFNIGIMAGYNNMAMVDMDFKAFLDIDTLIDSTPRGFHYYFKLDKPMEGVVFKIAEGPYRGKSPLMIKTKGYVVSPYSVYNGKTYTWIRTDRLMKVKGEKLVEVFEKFYVRNYTKILKLFKPE